ncbi:hypothetical protein PGB90_010610 [Kerria lacca]
MQDTDRNSVSRAPSRIEKRLSQLGDNVRSLTAALVCVQDDSWDEHLSVGIDSLKYQQSFLNHFFSEEVQDSIQVQFKTSKIINNKPEEILSYIDLWHTCLRALSYYQWLPKQIIKQLTNKMSNNIKPYLKTRSYTNIQDFKNTVARLLLVAQLSRQHTVNAGSTGTERKQNRITEIIRVQLILELIMVTRATVNQPD